MEVTIKYMAEEKPLGFCSIKGPKGKSNWQEMKEKDSLYGEI